MRFTNHLKRLLRRLGFEVFLRKTMARGITLDCDLERLFGGTRLRTIFDVGANVGQSALWFASTFPTAQVYSFEPVQATFQNMVKNVVGQGRIKPYNLALGSVDGAARMQILKKSVWNRIVSDETAESPIPTEKVNMQRVDTFCSAEDVESIDLLKTDCEGYDLQVLQGSEGLLLTKRIATVYCEVNFRRDGMHGDFFEIEQFLRPFGYSFCGLYDCSSWQQDVAQVGFANALFVRNDLCAGAATQVGTVAGK